MNRVKNFIGAMREKGVRTVKRAVPAFFTAYCYFSMYVPVYAAKATGTSVITSGFNSLYEIVAAIVSSIGQLLLLWGVFEYGYWLGTILSTLWSAFYTGSNRMQLFNAVDSIQPVYKAVPAHDISTLCDVCTCRRSGDRA